MRASDILKTITNQYKADRLNPPAKLNMPGNGFTLKKDHRLVILGGMPGTGKSAYMSAEAALKLAGQNVLVFVMTYEMHENKVVERLLCNGSCTKCDDYDDYKLSDMEVDSAFDQVAERLERIFIASPRSVEEVRTYINSKINDPDTSDSQDKPQIVIVWDYLQRIPLRSDIDDSRLRIAANLQAIIDLNHEFDAQSVILSSLNRKNYDSTSMEAFKEAGDIESDCDLAIIMRIAEMDDGARSWVSRKGCGRIAKVFRYCFPDHRQLFDVTNRQRPRCISKRW
ncbi:MAG: DnaB-like helicase C-terminal domain-containing protein [Desulfuromonadales bacterium]